MFHVGSPFGLLVGRLAVTAAIDKEKSNGLNEDLEPGLERQ
jgi:hypothetical protein